MKQDDEMDVTDRVRQNLLKPVSELTKHEWMAGMVIQGLMANKHNDVGGNGQMVDLFAKKAVEVAGAVIYWLDVDNIDRIDE